MPLAIITAYFKEDRATLQRCLDSVRAQTAPVEHIVVADGHPQEWVPATGVRHIVLDRSHGDFGDTPRMVGAALAIREGFDAIQFLDADNMLDANHAEIALGALRETGAHVLVLRRRFLRPDGSVLPYRSRNDETLRGIDTNCYLFARPAFGTALKWTLVPKELSHMGAKVFRAVLSQAAHPVAIAPTVTVGYTSMWPNTYTDIGETPPPGCRDHAERQAHARAWWRDLNESVRAQIESMLGVTITID